MADVGLVRLAADFGGEGNGGGNVNTDEARARFAAIQAECDRDGLRYFDITTSMTRLDVEAFARDIQKSLGIIYAHAEAGLVALPKADPPPVVDPPPDTPPPAPFPAGGFARTYSGHGNAWDFYPNGSDGPHHGWWALAPCPGRVEVYSFPTPLDVFKAMDADTRERHHALFDGWTCMDPELAGRILPAGHQGPLPPPWVSIAAVAPAQTMYVPVFRPDSPITLQGQRLVWLGQGHSRGETVTQGRVTQGQRMWQFWTSGVNFEARGVPGRAAHGHMICGASTTLSPNGDLPGGYAILALGMPLPQLTNGNWGPDAYMAGLIQAGQPASYWQTHPLPPPAE